MSIDGTRHNDHLSGTDFDDDFDLSQGGHDTAKGLGGQDTFIFGDAFGDRDRVFGGDGDDKLVLDGDYLLTLGARALNSVESLQLNGAHNYALTFDAHNIAPGGTLFINMQGVDTANVANVAAAADSRGALSVFGSTGINAIFGANGDDFLGGAGGNDTISTQAGSDLLYGGDGNDVIIFHGDNAFGDEDTASGDADIDTLILDGSYRNLHITDAMISGVETLQLAMAHTYKIDASQSGVIVSQVFVVDGRDLQAGDTLRFTARGQTGAGGAAGVGYVVFGGAGADTIVGSDIADIIQGGGGVDRMEGGDGSDEYQFASLSDSQGAAFDTIVGFDTHEDTFRFPTGHPINGLDEPVLSGTVNEAHFTHDLATNIGADELGAHNAVLFFVDHGDERNQFFLIADLNGHAGYQAGGDLVIRLVDGIDLRDLGEQNFPS